MHHLDSWIKRDQLHVTCSIISLFNPQNVSDVNTSETFWGLNNEIIKQVTLSWSLFIQGKESVEFYLRGYSTDKWITMPYWAWADICALLLCDTEWPFSSINNKRHCHVSAPFLTSLLPYYSGFHLLFLCTTDFLQNSKFTLYTFLHFHLLKFFYCYRCFFFYFGSLQLFISRDLCSFSDFTQGKMVNSYRRFGTTYRSSLSNSQTVYPYTQRNIPEESRSHSHRGRSLKSRLFISAVQILFVCRLVPSVALLLTPHKRLNPILFYVTLPL